MIGPEDLSGDPGVLELVLEGQRGEEVIDAPAEVSLPGAGDHVPPRVVVRAAVELAKRIQITGFDEPVHPGPLDRQEAGDVLVVLRAGQVDGFVGGAEVPADNDLLPLPLELRSEA